MKVSVDFETRSDVDIKTRGVFCYFESPHAKVLMAAYRIDDHPIRCWTYDQPPPADLWAAIEAGAEIHAYNAQFESLGFDLLADRHGWPRPRLEQYRDTAAAGAALALPRRLGDLAAALDLPVQKDKEGDRLIRLFSIPRKPRKGEPPGVYWNEPEDHPEEFARFKAYCMRDVETEEAAARRMVPLSDVEQAAWVLNQRINRRGIRIDRVSARAAIRLAEKSKRLLDAEMKEATNGAVTACSQVARLTEWLGEQGVPLDSLGKSEIGDLLDTDDLPPNVRKALELRQEAAKTSVSKLKTMLARANSDGRARGTGIYHAASTGREQSTGINFNNLPRPRKVFEDAHLNRELLFRAIRSEDPELLRFLYPEEPKPYAPEVAPYLLPSSDGALGRPLHLISDALRSFIWSAPGYDLLQADYSGIEGAVAAWVADENWKVAELRAIAEDPKRPDMYRQTAAFILNTTTDVVTKKHPLRQAVGKTSELALGFGGGVMAFVGMARNYNVRLRPLFEPVWEASDPERREKAAWRFESVEKRNKEGTRLLGREAWVACEIIKTGWRSQNASIAAAWHALEDVVREAIRAPGTTVKTLNGRVAYLVRQGFLWCRLPSGRCLAYAGPKLKDQMWVKVKLEDGTWSDPETMDREEAEAAELRGTVLIQGPTSPRITCLGVDKSGRRMVREGLYGGILFENVVQAIARDLLENGKLRAEAAGYPIVFTVYDEIVTEVPCGWGGLKVFENLICELPPWADGLPLTAGGWRGKRYRKD